MNNPDEQRSVPSGIPGISYRLHRPRIVFEVTVDDQQITLDQFQVASALTLTLLRTAHGVLRTATVRWRQAWRDVERVESWGMQMMADRDQNLLEFRLRHHAAGRVSVAGVQLHRDGLVVGGPTDPPFPAGSATGDDETDRRIGVVLALLRQSGGVLATSLGHFVVAAYDVHVAHTWSVIPETDGSTTRFHLFEPAEPPHVQRFG